MTNTPMTCERLEELLPDYLDETLGESDRLTVESHLAGCPACGPLVADVRGIVAEAGALPALRPSRDLWAGIEARIATPVVQIGPRPSALGSRPPLSRRWLAAAAVLLVATTAGVTYQVTKRMQGDTQVAAQTPSDTVRATSPDSMPAAARTVASGIPEGPFAPPPPDRDAVVPAAPPQRPADGRGPRAESREQRRTQTPRATPETRLAGGETPPDDASPASPIEQAYAKELAELALMVRERRGELDPATVAVLEHSIKVIDQAIAQSKDALQRDPASGFLQDQLNHALDKKVTLLRTAARLPSRT